MNAKAILTKMQEVPSPEYLRFSFDVVFYGQNGYLDTANFDVYFDYSSSQVTIRNSIKSAIISEGAKRGYTVAQNDILYPLQG